jgi:hypothetical protein
MRQVCWQEGVAGGSLYEKLDIVMSFLQWSVVKSWYIGKWAPHGRDCAQFHLWWSSNLLLYYETGGLSQLNTLYLDLLCMIYVMDGENNFMHYTWHHLVMRTKLRRFIFGRNRRIINCHEEIYTHLFLSLFKLVCLQLLVNSSRLKWTYILWHWKL